MQKKYTEWSKLLIEPMSMNDARLYAVETRLHKEEDMRVHEVNYLRDMVKKLVLTIIEDSKTLNGDFMDVDSF